MRPLARSSTIAILPLVILALAGSLPASAAETFNFVWWGLDSACSTEWTGDPPRPIPGWTQGYGLAVRTVNHLGDETLHLGGNAFVTNGPSGVAGNFSGECRELGYPVEIAWHSSPTGTPRAGFALGLWFGSGPDFAEVFARGVQVVVSGEIGAPAAGATVANTTPVSMTADGPLPGTPLVFRLLADGTQVATVTSTTLRSTANWNTTTVGNGPHRLDMMVLDTAGNVLATDSRTVNVANATAAGLQVFITSPRAGATVSGTVALSIWLEGAVAGSNTYAVAVDGKTVATETCACLHVWPGWNTRLVPNGAHTLSVTARDSAGKTATATMILIAAN
jgi:hypothetical protein